MTADASAAYQLPLGPQNAENAFDKELDNEMALPATIAIRFLERAQSKFVFNPLDAKQQER